MLFSIIIPVYNRELLLKRSLESVLRQDYRPIQLIIVDNNSTDNSLLEANKFKKNERTDFIIDVLEEKYPGACAARNKGLEYAKGEYVYFFDSDDEMSSNYLSDVHQIIQKSLKSPDIIVSNTRIVSERGVRRKRLFIKNPTIIDQILTGVYATQTIMYSTSFIREIGKWNPYIKRWNDWELGVRVIQKSKVSLHLKSCYHIIYSHPQSITGTKYSASASDLMEACSIVKKDLCKSPGPNTKRELQALGFRILMLSAYIKKEGNVTQSLRILSRSFKLLKTKKMIAIGRFLYLYISKGGRGSWLIARFCLRFVSAKNQDIEVKLYDGRDAF